MSSAYGMETIFFMKKVIDFLVKKKVIGYDNFSGFPNPAKLKKSKKESILESQN